MRSSIAPGLSRPAAPWAAHVVAACALWGALAAAFFGAAAMAQSPASTELPALLAPGSPMPAMSDPRAADTAYAQAQRLADEGKPDDALAAIEVALKESPSDVRLRFLKGVILSGQGKDAAAIEVFQALTRQFPELPEPHNNLAALHAARGELDLARAALDEAVRALPSYALAHENLGDLHLRLAIRAWQRAAELEPANAAVASRLRLARELSRQIAPAAPGAAPLPGSR